MDYQPQPAPRVVLVTGPSGAGRSTAIKALEDIGFEAIDNLPLSLMERLFRGPPPVSSLALGIDTRNRDFSTAALIETLQWLEDQPDITPELLYLDCDRKTLLRRFSETRRRHPMAPVENPDSGIEREIDLLTPVRHRADILIDTSDLTPHGLRAEIERWFASEEGRALSVTLHSFSYKRGIPRGLDMVIDCRFLRNPHWDADLRALTGRNAAVADHVRADDRFIPFADQLETLLETLLPAYAEEGKSHFSLGFGCTGGQHRSVFVAEFFGAALAHGGWQVSIRHRELDRCDKTGLAGT